MLAMLRDLVAHHGHANAAVLAAIRGNAAAAADVAILDLLHHVLVANRFWLVTVLGQPFDFPHESRRAGSLDELIERYTATHEQQSQWVGAMTEADLARALEHPHIPGGRCSVAQALTQVCLHAHGHRAQCAKLLRRHGAEPPQTDFITWLVERPPARWSVPPG